MYAELDKDADVSDNNGLKYHTVGNIENGN